MTSSRFPVLAALRLGRSLLTQGPWSFVDACSGTALVHYGSQAPVSLRFRQLSLRESNRSALEGVSRVSIHDEQPEIRANPGPDERAKENDWRSFEEHREEAARCTR
jgi:hypothetical protein